MLYFAYGSNLLRSGMAARCPAAVPVSRGVLRDYRLVFRTFADVEPAVGSHVAGGLWRITPACLAALDAYEEVHAGLYRRRVLAVEAAHGRPSDAILYRMCGAAAAPPEASYLAAILLGCRDFGLDDAPVLAAAEAARDASAG